MGWEVHKGGMGMGWDVSVGEDVNGEGWQWGGSLWGGTSVEQDGYGVGGPWGGSAIGWDVYGAGGP